MDVLLTALIIFFIVLALVTVVGHAIWLTCTEVIRSFSKRPNQEASSQTILGWSCEVCHAEMRTGWTVCGRCGAQKPSEPAVQSLKDLKTTEREIERLHSEGKIVQVTFDQVAEVLTEEISLLTSPEQPAAETVREPTLPDKKVRWASPVFETPTSFAVHLLPSEQVSTNVPPKTEQVFGDSGGEDP